MDSHHVAAGVVLLAGTLSLVGWRYVRRPRGALPLRGWLGVSVIAVVSVLLGRHAAGWVDTYFTPIVWTGYILLADAVVGSLGRPSRMHSRPGEFAALALTSIPLWLIFELYNLRLHNWTYVGLPASAVQQVIGYAWSFATIWPAIYETADVFAALDLFAKTAPHRKPSTPGRRRTLVAIGLILVSAPLLVPTRIGSFLFGAVWLGFIPLLDPLTYDMQGPSLLREWEAGNYRVPGCFLASGWLCGLLWEFFNYWAAARWVYVFPIGQRWKIFEMPALGFAGFPAFALECWVMWEFIGTLWRRHSPSVVRVTGTVQPVENRD